MSTVRADLVGVVWYTVDGGQPRSLKAGDEIPDGVEVGDHLVDNESGYGSLRADELKAEIAKRNEGREDDAKIPAVGRKADLVAALEADDAK